jgi:hypothetical protein
MTKQDARGPLVRYLEMGGGGVEDVKKYRFIIINLVKFIH